MSKYRLTVVEIIELTPGEKQERGLAKRYAYDGRAEVYAEEDVKHMRTLEVEITAEEWQKVKMAVLGVV